MKVGFTGTQVGITTEQKERVASLLNSNTITEVHHGDCIGADKQFHDLAKEKQYSIIIHPPTNEVKRAFCKGGALLLKKPYLDRNRDIVNSVDLLIGCPKGEETQRSGTWMTIRYAKTKGKLIRIIYPNGNMEVEEKCQK